MVGGDQQRRQVVDFWRCTAFVLSYSLTATRNHINDFFSGGSISGWEKLFLFVGDGFDIMVAGFYVCTSLDPPQLVTSWVKSFGLAYWIVKWDWPSSLDRY